MRMVSYRGAPMIRAAREASMSRRLGMADPCLLRFDPGVNATRDLGRLQLPPAGERGRMAERRLLPRRAQRPRRGDARMQIESGAGDQQVHLEPKHAERLTL